MIQLKNLSKKFDLANEQIKVLKNINLDLKASDTLSIVGPSGSGKTTLLSMVAGLDHPSEGSVIVNNQNISKMKDEDLTSFRGKEIGIIFQTFHLINYMTAKENIELVYGLKDDVIDVDAALDSVGLGHRKNHFPYQLSGGECQRLAIARALAAKPSIIIADEPSGNLDRETGNKVMDLLFDLVEQESATLILVTHDIELAKRTKLQMMIQDGCLYEA